MMSLTINNTYIHKNTYIKFLLKFLSVKGLIGFFNHFKLCLADVIYNFKSVKIIRIWQNGGQRF